MKQSILYALFAGLITAAFITGAPAFAQTPQSQDETRVSLVSTADLELGTRAGQRQLQQRLARAAREVCGTASAADLEGANKLHKCRADAIARASSQATELVAAAPRVDAIAVTAAR